MKLGSRLSSIFKNIPNKYYNPQNEFEYSLLTRREKLPVKIYKSEEEVSIYVCKEIVTTIKEKQALSNQLVIAIHSGYYLQSIYKELVRMHIEERLSFRNVILFNIYEYYPLQPYSDSSFSFLKKNLIDHIDIPIGQIYTPNGQMNKKCIINHCRNYEKIIAKYGGIDFMLLGLGKSGNIGINMSGSDTNSFTRMVVLDDPSREEAASSIFGTVSNVPVGAITMGLATIMKSKRIIIVAFGEEKSNSIYNVVENSEASTINTCLYEHQNLCFYIDRLAANKLTRINQPWVLDTCEWDDKLIRRAIIQLCQKTGKPILKLTNKDYQNNHLEELLSRYSSAYNVNIRVFNDLQHTITGWPGGKPNVDDINRPEKSLPYPKKIVIFSPHPDDDVISMGGTFRRLLEQNHDVYVAYETSGNIAVNDDDAFRYVCFLKDILWKYDPNNIVLKNKYNDILYCLLHKKKEVNVMEIKDILFIKTCIRRQEAIGACRYMGLDTNKICFLNLPFYETGQIRKNFFSKKDIEIVKNYLRKLQPDRIFVASDFIDPHGTHKMCFDLILVAINELNGEKWLNNCRIWMYRGAWQEWQIEDIEMAVPISPEELRSKRNAILRHQSQMEGALFFGNDERLFWQRSEDRNHTTAELYKQLGLADYEAIEAFVEYKLV
jgi:glucosamine-6-phosphate deaminase